MWRKRERKKTEERKKNMEMLSFYVGEKKEKGG